MRQYIGARYVTKIYENSLDPSSAEWQANVNYEPLIMVTYNNGSYLSKKEVPANIGDPASNPSYWVQTGFYNGQIMYLQQQIDEIKEGYVTPEMYGAVGDGVADDTTAFNDALANADGLPVVCTPGKTYHITSTLIIPFGMSLDGNDCVITVDSDFNNTARTDLPNRVAIWVEGREPVAGSEQAGINKTIQNIRLKNLTSSSGFVGMYLGYATALYTTVSKVNYAVYGYNFDRISISGFDDSLYLAEAWSNNFHDIKTFATEYGIAFKGQSVNNNFSNIYVGGTNTSTGIYFDVNPNYNNRPEGINITNSIIVENKIGIHINNALEVNFENCVDDLNTEVAIYLTTPDSVKFSNCWIESRLNAADSSPTKAVVVLASTSNRKSSLFTNCHFVNINGGRIVAVGQNRSDGFINCEFPDSPFAIYYTNSNIRVIGCRLLSGDTYYTEGVGSAPIVIGSFDDGTDFAKYDLLHLNAHLKYLNGVNSSTATTKLFTPVANSQYLIIIKHAIAVNVTRNSMYLISTGGGTITTVNPLEITDGVVSATFAVDGDGDIEVTSSTNYYYAWVFRVDM